jgi:DNA-binding beta-propeller fold protein YncE
VCAEQSREVCQPGRESSAAGGFSFPASVATDPRTGDLYVADLDNYRVQRFTASGRFLAMFGWGVNKTRHEVATRRSAGNVCTAASGDLCGAGKSGTAAGQLRYPASIAVAPKTGAVYVLEAGPGDRRVDKYTADGRFEWAIGKGVNETTKVNICRSHEIERLGGRCGAGQENKSDSIEPAAFKFPPQYGDLLAVGGPEELLFVGDEHRVQRFDSRGRWRGEILLASISSKEGSSAGSLAVDKHGDLFLAYSVVGRESGVRTERVDVVRKFNPSGEQVAQFPVEPRLANASVHIDGIAIDASNEIAVIGLEVGRGFTQRFGSLYQGDTGRLIGEFAPPRDNDGLTFNAEGELFVAATDDQEIVSYVPAPASALATSPVTCRVEPAVNSSISFECALDRAMS